MRLCPKHEWAYPDDGACRWCEPAGCQVAILEATPPPGTPPPTPEMLDWVDRQFASLVAETLWEAHGLIDENIERVVEAGRAKQAPEAAPEFTLRHDGNVYSAGHPPRFPRVTVPGERRDPKQDEIVRAIERDEERAKLWDELRAMFGIKER